MLHYYYYANISKRKSTYLYYKGLVHDAPKQYTRARECIHTQIHKQENKQCLTNDDYYGYLHNF